MPVGKRPVVQRRGASAEHQTIVPAPLQESFMSSPWYAQDILTIVRALKTDLRTGLTTKEAVSRVRDHDNVDVVPFTEPPLWSLVWQQARNLRTGLLALVVVASFVVGWSIASATVWMGTLILIALMIDIALRTTQRVLVSQQLRLARTGLRRKARVQRNGEIVFIDPQDIVEGDILRVRAGDYVPADARLFAATELRINEVPVTGVSDPVPKGVDDLRGDLAVQDQTNMLFAGTYVYSGTGSAIVVATGNDRYICHLYSERTLELPFVSAHEQLAQVFPKIAWLGALAGLVLAALLSQTGAPGAASTIHAVTVGIALFVAVLPIHAELATLVLFVQNLRQLVRMGVAVQQPEALERLSLASTLCFDPQAVLTRDEMALQSVYVDATVMTGEQIRRFYRNSDAGSTLRENPTYVVADSLGGAFVEEAAAHNPDEPPPDLYFLFVAAALTTMHVDVGEDGREATEPRVKAALLDAARVVGVDTSSFRSLLIRVNDLPFDSVRRRQSVLFRTSHDRGYLFSVGSPDVLLNASKMVRINDDEDVLQSRQRELLMMVQDHMRSESVQVLGVAYRKITGDMDVAGQAISRLEDNLTFLGMLSFNDPLRTDLRKTFEDCSRAGLRLILTSDAEPQVALRLARGAGLVENRSQFLTSEQLRMMEDDDLMPATDRVTVYAQLKADQKARLMSILARKDNSVAFVGRQLYDIPAMRAADVSVAPSRFSVDAAVHAAGIVVEDATLGNLYQVLKFAKEAGRGLRRALHWILCTHFGLGMVFALGWLLGLVGLGAPSPLELAQLVWLELLVYAIPFTFAARDFRMPESKRWSAVLRSGRSGVKWAQVVSHGLIVALMSLFAGGILYRVVPPTQMRDLASQFATMTTFVLASLVVLMRGLSDRETSFREFVRLNRWLAGGVGVSALVAFVLPFTPIAGFFASPETAALGGLTPRLVWLAMLVFPIAAWFVPHSE
jgi:Ca2+-transporting ATPase